MQVPALSVFNLCPGAWGFACVVAFCVWYADPDARYNPQHQSQLRSLSGIMTFDKPLFSFLMSCFGGTSFAGMLIRFQQQPFAVILTLVLFWALLGLLCFDVRDHRTLHFTFFFAFMASGATLTHVADPRDVSVVACDIVLALFFGVLLINLALVGNAAPIMTIQALCEILWAAVFSAWVVNQAATE